MLLHFAVERNCYRNRSSYNIFAFEDTLNHGRKEHHTGRQSLHAFQHRPTLDTCLASQISTKLDSRRRSRFHFVPNIYTKVDTMASLDRCRTKMGVPYLG
jgi:hypothetical protein